MAYTPPAGFDDALHDALETPTVEGKYHEIELDFATFLARRPMPNAIGMLGNAVNAKIPVEEQVNYIGLFVRNHLHPDSFDDLIRGMMEGEYPANAIEEVNRAIATRGTSRPTRRS